MRIYCFVFIGLLCVTSTWGQRSEIWRGLTLGITTPSDVIKLYGKPKTDRLEKSKVANAISSSTDGQTMVRSLVYEKVDSLNKLRLMFANEKLYSMIHYPKNKTRIAADLTSQFSSDFLFLEGLPKKFDFAQLEGQKETTVPKVYPVVYYMLAVQNDRIIIATINNNSWKAIWRDGIKKPTVEMFPAYVESIQIFTRKIEKN